MTELDVEHILQTYTLEDILELNDLTEEDLLEYLFDTGFVSLDPLPVDA